MTAELTDEEQREEDERRLKRPVGKLPLFEGPKLLILKEKHGTSYYFIPNEAHLHAVALQVLTERLKEGWYGKESNFKDDSGLTPKQKYKNLLEERERCAQIEDEEIRDAALKIMEGRISDLKWSERVTREIRGIHAAVRLGNGEFAWQMLIDRSDLQYEGYQLERFKNIDSAGVSTVELIPRPTDPYHGCEWVDADGGRWVYDEKTIGDWIPKIYASLLYNVEHFQGKPVVRRLDHGELEAYARVEKKVKREP